MENRTAVSRLQPLPFGHPGQQEALRQEVAGRQRHPLLPARLAPACCASCSLAGHFLAGRFPAGRFPAGRFLASLLVAGLFLFHPPSLSAALAGEAPAGKTGSDEAGRDEAGAGETLPPAWTELLDALPRLEQDLERADRLAFLHRLDDLGRQQTIPLPLLAATATQQAPWMAEEILDVLLSSRPSSLPASVQPGNPLSHPSQEDEALALFAGILIARDGQQAMPLAEHFHQQAPAVPLPLLQALARRLGSLHNGPLSAHFLAGEEQPDDRRLRQAMEAGRQAALQAQQLCGRFWRQVSVSRPAQSRFPRGSLLETPASPPASALMPTEPRPTAREFLLQLQRMGLYTPPSAS